MSVMQIIEQITCKKCSTSNPVYTSICVNCKSYLRERVVNIDLWKMIGLLIEDSQNAFRQLIYAENKNFIIFILLFLSLKNLIIARFLSVPLLGKEGVTTSFIISYLLMIFSTSLIIVGFSFLLMNVYKKLNIQLRFKDIFAINVYVFIPLIFSLIFILPVELAVLGGDIFSNNPTPFQIKSNVSYMLLGFEVIAFLWSFLLLVKSIIFISGKLFLSILLTGLFLIVVIALYFASSQIIFSL